MKERLLVVLAFLAFLVPGGLAWLDYATDPPPMPDDMRRAAGHFIDATAYNGDVLVVCREVETLQPWLVRGGDGSLGERARAPFQEAQELAESVRKDCHGGAPLTEISGRVKRLRSGLPEFARQRWYEGRKGVLRVSVLVLAPIELLVALLLWQLRRREQRRLDAIAGGP